MDNKLDLFKIAIICIGLVITIILYGHSQNGRYVEHREGVLDTRTGSVYTWEDFHNHQLHENTLDK